MRKSVLFRTAVAAATLSFGFAAGASATTPPVDPSQILDQLTPEQLSCLFENAGALNTDDMTAMLATFESCGITIEDILAIGTGATTSTGSAVGSSVPTDPLAAGTSVTLAALGVDAAAEVCVSASIAAAPPADDNAALAVLQSCGVSLVSIVTGIGGGGAPVAGTPGSVPAGTAAATGNPMIDAVVTQLKTQFPNLDDTQLTCLATAAVDNLEVFSNASQDPSAMLGLLEGCGIALSDIS